MPFQKGNKLSNGGKRPGSGRKPEEWKLIFNEALSSATTIEDLEQVIGTLRDRAKSGDSRAAALYLGYVVGKPVERQEISGPDGGPVKHELFESDEESVIAAADAIRCRREKLPAL